jgi:hypothetical protein
MTRTTPRLLMILHFSQRRFTDGLTFTIHLPQSTSGASCHTPVLQNPWTLAHPALYITSQPGENLRAVLGDSHRMLKMSRQRTISRHHSPMIIQHPCFPVSDHHHGLKCESHAGS